MGIGTGAFPTEKLTLDQGNFALTGTSSWWRYITAKTQTSVFSIGTDPNVLTGEANGPMIQMLGTSNGWVPGRINYYSRSSVGGSHGTTISQSFANYNASVSSFITLMNLHDYDGKGVATIGDVPLPTTSDYGLMTDRGILSRKYLAGGASIGLFEVKEIGGEAVAIIGDVPLPTLSPNKYGLLVKNGILTTKVRVALTGTPEWADYVFADDYKLMPLKKLEQFIATENHLPEIPSAEEVVKEGVDLGQMQAKLLQKIEELTLYVIQQQKEIDALKKKVSPTKN